LVERLLYTQTVSCSSHESSCVLSSSFIGHIYRTSSKLSSFSAYLSEI